MTNKILKEIKRNKIKISFFLVGYLMLILDYRMLIAMEDLLKLFETFYLIIFNLIFIFIMFPIIKKIIKIYTEIIILKNDKGYIKIFKYLKVISLGAFIGFITMIFQSFVIVLLPF